MWVMAPNGIGVMRSSTKGGIWVSEANRIHRVVRPERSEGKARSAAEFFNRQICRVILMKTNIIINDLPSKQNNHQHVEN